LELHAVDERFDAVADVVTDEGDAFDTLFLERHSRRL
jgi:hypothetical protein